MIYSPIKTKLTNNCDKPFIAPISSHTRIHLNPKGTAGDCITLSGDVFTMADRTPIAEALMEAILDRRIVLSYSIDKVAEVRTGCVGNFNSCSRLSDRVAEFELYPPMDIVDVTPTKDEQATATETPEAEDTKVVEEPAPVNEDEKLVADSVSEDTKVVEEPSKSEESMIVDAAEEADKGTQDIAEVAEAKPTKKKRQIKIN